MGLVLVFAWRSASWPSLLTILDGPKLLLFPLKAPTLHKHFPRAGRACPRPLGQMMASSSHEQRGSPGPAFCKQGKCHCGWITGPMEELSHLGSSKDWGGLW